MPSIDELKEQQRKQWSGSAANWDNQHENRERETAAVTDWLLREARITAGMRVLDLACGSGHPSLTIAGIVGGSGSVVATDLVPEMVAVTARRASEAGLSNLETRVTDAEAIDFRASSFDAVTCRFGMMFCARPAVAISEVHKVLKPGGRFALSVWSEPQYSPAQTVGGEALRRCGRPQPAVDFDVPGIYQLAPEGKLRRLLLGAGFREVRVEPITLISEYASIDAFLGPQAMRTGAFRAVFDEATDEERGRLRMALTDVLMPYMVDGTIRLTLTPLCAVASK